MNLGNEIIAKFLGWELCKCGDKEPHYKYGIMNWHTIKVEDMVFHKSWDALKPIIDKISDIGIDNTEILLSDYYRNVVKYSVTVRIDVVYDDVVKFIEWYTSLNTQRTYLEQNGPKV